jgi:hypothetical protein
MEGFRTVRADVAPLKGRMDDVAVHEACGGLAFAAARFLS